MGRGDGSDWTHAFPAVPSMLLRGYTYYVADGTYPGFNASAATGTERITIKKATALDHGTEMGWATDHSFGDGKAVFTSGISVSTSYLTIDGQVGGGPGSWNSGHGIEVTATGNACRDNGSLLGIGQGATELVFRHMHLYSPNYNFPMNGIKGTQGASSLHFSHMSVHHTFGPTFHIGSWKDVVIENSYLADVRSTGEGDPYCSHWHAEGISSIGTNENITIKNNIWHKIGGTAVIAGVNSGLSSNWKVYGNIISQSINPIAYYYEAGSNRQEMNGLEFHHNTIVSSPGASSGSIQIQRGSGNRAFNNIWYANNSNTLSFGNVEHDYNVYIDNFRTDGCNPACDRDAEGAQGESNGLIGTGNPFVNWNGTDVLNADFRLKVPLAAGVPLSSTFETDPLNASRKEGGWDRGAYQSSSN